MITGQKCSCECVVLQDFENCLQFDFALSRTGLATLKLNRTQQMLINVGLFSFT